jgi:hypothetical protein
MPPTIRQSARVFFITGLFFFANVSFCSDQYFRCGPDEDGCFNDEHQYCACIAYDDAHANDPYCLDNTNSFEPQCTPISLVFYCKPELIFKNQSACLATLFQSKPNPPCAITTHADCLEGHSPICNANGGMSTCHYE